MANVKVPLKFQILRGGDVIREEVLNEPVIRVGKLASSHLRFEDDSVSRMHAVIEVNGPDDVLLIDLGSTRGTLVNGEKITKRALHSGDEIVFGDVHVFLTFLEREEATVVAPHVAATAAAQPMARAPQPPPTSILPGAGAPPPPMAAQGVQPGSTSVLPPSQAPAYAPPPFGAAPPPSPYAQTSGGGTYAPTPPPASAYNPNNSGMNFAAPVNPVAAEVEVHDGTRAIEVQALFRGVVVSTQHLYDPNIKASASKAKPMILGGVALIVGVLGLFMYTVADVGREKAAQEAFEKQAGETGSPRKFEPKPHSPGEDVALIGGVGIGLALIYMGLKRRQKSSPDYIIGVDPDADAAVAPEFTGGGSHILVGHQGGDYVVSVTPSMTGEMLVDGQRMPLSQWVQQRGASFPMPERGRARIDCGESTFLVNATPKPRTLEVPFLTWETRFLTYAGGSAVTLLLFLLMIFAVPPDPKSLSLDLLNSDNRFVNFLIKPPEEKDEVPDWLKDKGKDEAGGKGQAHKGESGKMGKKDSKNDKGLYGLKGPKDNPDPHLAKKLAEEQVKDSGVLGVLKMAEGSHLASIFGRDTALGNDPSNVLGGLVGNEIGEAYGVGGLGLTGTGAGGGGTGEGTIGLGNFGTIGKGGGGGNGSGYGRGAGGLGGRHAKSPDVIPGQAAVRGSLDKEIIRRIIRRHINEVKYCYEQELTRKPDLGGRVSVQFTIAATGQVIASVLQNSTMNNTRVDVCVVNAVRRWEFPKPLGGGIVIVTYPFQFNPAGGGE